MFTRHCFIRKNTPELREKLKDLGYKVHELTETKYRRYGIFCNRKVAIGVPSPEDFDMQRYLNEYQHIIDCDDNEELFLAIAALQDDSDENQWFVYPKENHWFKCYDNNIEEVRNEPSTRMSCQAAWFYNSHKATVEELIEHFKNK